MTHHWENPCFAMHTGPLNEWTNWTPEAAFRQYVLNWLPTGETTDDAHYYGLNELRQELVTDRTFIRVFIVTPHHAQAGPWRLDSNIPFYPNQVARIGRLLIDQLEIDRSDIRIMTYPKGRHVWGPTPRPWSGMLTWQYAPFQPARFGDGEFVPSRALRLRWGEDIFFQQIWCIPGTEGSQAGVKKRQEETPSATFDLPDWVSGTAEPTNAINATELVCELPQRTRTSTPTTATGTGTGTGTTSWPQTTIHLTGTFLDPPATTTSTPSTTTASTPSPTAVSGTVKYRIFLYMTFNTSNWEAAGEVKTFRGPRSIDNISDDDASYDLVGDARFDQMVLLGLTLGDDENREQKLENSITDGATYPGDMSLWFRQGSIIFDEDEGVHRPDEWQLDYEWLGRIWVANGTECSGRNGEREWPLTVSDHTLTFDL